MIPVKQQPEPPDFNAKVRLPGQQYLQQHPHTTASKLRAFWQGDMEKQLWEKYDGICAYLSLYIEYTTGAVSVDHFVAKSRDRQKAYEWENYRLACWGINRKKGTQTVLDPFTLRPNSFEIDFSDGSIVPNPDNGQAYQKQCADTIAILELDSADNRKWRSRLFDEYCSGNVSLDHIKNESPFVHAEIIRQNLQRD